MARKRVGIVKIDVEGAELEVVKSLLNLIERDKPIILIEVLPVHSDENAFRKDRQEELEKIFTVILRVEKTRANTYSGLRHVEKIGIHSDLTQCDYVVVTNEQLKSCFKSNTFQIRLRKSLKKLYGPPETSEV